MLAYFLVVLLSYAVAYWIVGTKNNLWRAVVGFPVALLVGWLGGTFISIFTLVPLFGGDPAASMPPLLGKGFWWALFGVIIGTRRAWRKLGLVGANGPTKKLPELAGEAANDGVMAERAAEAEREAKAKRDRAALDEQRRRNADLQASRLPVRQEAHAEKERENAAGRADAETVRELNEKASITPATESKVLAQSLPPEKTNNWRIALVLVISFVALAAFFAGKSSQVQQLTPASIQSGETAAPQDLTDEEARKLHFEEIYRSHPDTGQIVESDEFKAWLNKPGNDVWIETRRTGTATQVIAMLDSFKADQKSFPQPLVDRPSNPQTAPQTVNVIPPRPPATRISLQDFQRRTDVRSALKRSYEDYPYLQTEDGREAVRLIMLRAIDLVQNNGYHPVDAVGHAVNLIAHRHEPVWYKAGHPDTNAPNASIEAEKPARPCRMVTASPMQFECD